MSRTLHYLVLSATGLVLLGLGLLAGYQALKIGSAGDYRLLAVANPRDKAVKPSFPFPQGLVDQVNSQGVADAATAPAYSGYTRITDDSEALTVFVPKEWTDIETGKWVYQGQAIGTYIQASTDLDKFINTRSVSGVFIGASKALAARGSNTDLLTAQRSNSSAGCHYGGQTSFTDSFYLGDYDYFLNCANRGQNLVQVVARPPNGDYAILLQIKAKSKEDLAAAAEILNTFQVIDDLDRGDH